MFQVRRIFERGSEETGGRIFETRFRLQAHRIQGERDGDDLPDFGGDFESLGNRIQGNVDQEQHRRIGSCQSEGWRRTNSGILLIFKNIIQLFFQFPNFCDPQ